MLRKAPGSTPTARRALRLCSAPRISGACDDRPRPRRRHLPAQGRARRGRLERGPDRLAPKLVEWRDRWTGRRRRCWCCRAATAEVAAVVGICAEHGVAITPQGGNTGLVGGQIPDGEILLSLERLRAVREVDGRGRRAWSSRPASPWPKRTTRRPQVGRLFPLALASEGSATIGGLISTNAGGVAVLRYGTMREPGAGAGGGAAERRVWNGLKRLRKDNTGYDLKQLLIGAEGTLGVVTAASLKLLSALALAGGGHRRPGRARPRPCSCCSRQGRDRRRRGGFELIGRLGIDFALQEHPGRPRSAGGPPALVRADRDRQRRGRRGRGGHGAAAGAAPSRAS